MTAILTLTRYKPGNIFFALNAMALFRPFLQFNKHFRFHRLLGCGRNGTFDLHPDWNQYGIFTISDIDGGNASQMSADYLSWKKLYYGKFISTWWSFFGVETWTIVLRPVMAHGRWGGKEVLQQEYPPSAFEGPIAVLTRASIRPSKAMAFWKNVASVEQEMRKNSGLKFSVGIGEMPLLRQATFSIWTDAEAMKSFAYKLSEHKEVLTAKQGMKNGTVKSYLQDLFRCKLRVP